MILIYTQAIAQKDVFSKLILKHNDYLLAPDKIEIKREMLYEYQLKIADLYNVSIGKVEKLVPNFFNKEKCVLHYENLSFTWD